MTVKSSQWNSPVLWLAVFSLGWNVYWSVAAVSHTDNTALVKQVTENTIAISNIQLRLDLNKARRDEQLHEIIARLDRMDQHRGRQ